VTQPAFYFVDVVNTSNGCHSYDTIEVVSNSVFPDFTVSNGILNCNESELTLDFIINNLYDSISWTGPMEFQSQEETPLINNSGTYDVFVDLGAGCVIDTFIVISEDFSLPAFDIEFDSITCNKTSAEIILESEENSIVSLTDPDGAIFSDIVIHSTEIAGEYTVVVIGENGCIDSINFELLSFVDTPFFDVEVLGPITCINEMSGFEASGNSELIYSWFGPNGFTEEEAEITVAEGGQYDLVVEDIYGCTASASFNLEEFLDAPMIDLGAGMINCEVSETEVTLDGQGNDDNIEWRMNGNFISDEAIVTVNEGGIYNCQVTNEYGCIAVDSVEVVENTDSPQIIPITTTDLVFLPSDIDKEIIIEVNSSVDYSIRWIPEEAVSCIDCENPTLNDLTIDSLVVIVENIYGCLDTVVFSIRSEFLPEVYIPNVFSPNDDGINDFFTLFGNEEIQEVTTMLIYDRWGNRVEEKINIAPSDPQVGWDGKLNDQNVLVGVYAYYFKVLTVDGEEIEFVGNVTVVR